ncbi:MAG: U32 family peptidase, partial [Clostridia bacterium]|nr:U32 family peptidase [Clostridia bacterium]
RFPVARSGDACELLNSRPLWLADRRDEFPGAAFALLYMTTETADEAADVLERYEQAAAPAGDFTRGLGWKGVL